MIALNTGIGSVLGSKSFAIQILGEGIGTGIGGGFDCFVGLIFRAMLEDARRDSQGTQCSKR